MKKNKISLIAASLMAIVGLVGCSKESPEEVSVSKMALSGIATAYKTGETIPWENVKVTVSYSDKTTTTFTGSQIEFDVTSEVQQATNVVVYTDGLHAQAVPSEGTYNVEAALKTDLTKKFSLGRIVVGKVTSDKYDLLSFEEPETIDAYRRHIAVSSDLEAGFFDTSELLTVGTLNTFKYEPKAAFRNKESKAVEVSPNYEKTFSLRQINGSERSNVEFATYAEKVSGGVKFKEAAAGKSFELSCSPAEFDSTFSGTTPLLKLDLKVERGLNIYSAKELGAMNLTQWTINDFSNPNDGEHYYSYHYSTINDRGTYHNYWEYYDASKTTGHFKAMDTTALWRQFLVDSGTFTAEEEVAYQDSPAFFLQDSIEINKEDIPHEFFIDGKEAQTVDTDGDGKYDCDGYLRDSVDVYTPIVVDQDVTINGNYFSLGSKIGTCKNKRGDNEALYYDDQFNLSPANGFEPGHSTLIKFCGRHHCYRYEYETGKFVWTQSEKEYFNRQEDTSNGHIGTIKNLDTNGFTSVDYIPEQKPGETETQYEQRCQNEAVLSMTALIFAKNSYCGADYYNNIVKQYQIGLFPDTMVEGTREHVGLHGEGTIHFNTLIKNCKVFDCPNCGICNYHNRGTIVEHSVFNRYGGASLVNMGYKASAEDQSNGYIIDTERAKTYFTSDCEIKNYIIGEETYFKSVGASSFFALLNVYEDFFNAVGNTYKFIDNGVAKYNLLSLNMDGQAALASPNKDHYSDVILDMDKAEGQGYLDACNGGSANFAIVQTLHDNITAMAGVDTWVPLFVTDAGEKFTCLFDGNTEHGNMTFSNLDMSPLTAQLQGKKFAAYLPAGNTTLVACFELAKTAA